MVYFGLSDLRVEVAMLIMVRMVTTMTTLVMTMMTMMMAARTET